MTKLVLAILCVARVAAADSWESRAERFSAGAFMHLELTGMTAVDEPASRLHDLVLAGVELHGFLARNKRVNYHIGFGGHAGSSLRRAGMAYDVQLLPIGVMVRLGRTSIVGVAGGIGASGAIGTLDDALTFPVEGVIELGGGRVRVIARGRATYVTSSGTQAGNREDLEYDAMLGLRIGRHYEDFDFPTGNGYFVAAAYRELEGMRFAGITIGYSIDMATPRGH